MSCNDRYGEKHRGRDRLKRAEKERGGECAKHTHIDLFLNIKVKRGCSSSGRALASYAKGLGFKSWPVQVWNLCASQ